MGESVLFSSLGAGDGRPGCAAGRGMVVASIDFLPLALTDGVGIGTSYCTRLGGCERWADLESDRCCCIWTGATAGVEGALLALAGAWFTRGLDNEGVLEGDVPFVLRCGTQLLAPVVCIPFGLCCPKACIHLFCLELVKYCNVALLCAIVSNVGTLSVRRFLVGGSPSTTMFAHGNASKHMHGFYRRQRCDRVGMGIRQARSVVSFLRSFFILKALASVGHSLCLEDGNGEGGRRSARICSYCGMDAA